MSKGIVIELQKDAINSDVGIENLLRKAFLVSKKLGLKDFEQWIRNEQEGYHGDVPPYRKLSGILRGWSPVYGWIPVIVPSTFKDTFRIVPYRDAISKISETYKENKKTVHLKYSDEICERLNEIIDSPFDTYFASAIPNSEFYGIIDGVRNKILEWTLLLEENNIIGSDMTFTEEEKMQAATTVEINQFINNFYNETKDISFDQQ